MNNAIAFLFILSVFTAGRAQSLPKYFTRSGIITFTSEAPMEKIVSTNNEVNFILNPATGTIASKVTMKSFLFEKEAMKDHFNSDYLQTDKYPSATFEGMILGIADYAKDGTCDVTVDGKLTIHGVEKSVKQAGKVIISKNTIKIKTEFTVQLSDYNVSVPNNYVKKISNTVTIKLEGALIPYQR